MTRILIVDDEPDIRSTLRAALEEDGYEVVEAPHTRGAREALEKKLPDLILLDIMMPGEDGLTFCRQLREEPGWKGLPVIFLTSRGQETSRIMGLEMGADDYVVKPFSVPELLARVKAVLRRRSGEMEEDEVISDGDIVVNLPGQSVKKGGETLALTAKEFQLLSLLMKKRGRVLSRSYLMGTIWGQDFEGTSRTIDQHIYKLRKALKESGKKIVAVGTAGYKWEDDR